jgi:hypothetical protein
MSAIRVEAHIVSNPVAEGQVSKSNQSVQWCSGYHMCLTHTRSPVRYRVEPDLSSNIHFIASETNDEWLFLFLFLLRLSSIVHICGKVGWVAGDSCLGYIYCIELRLFSLVGQSIGTNWWGRYTHKIRSLGEQGSWERLGEGWIQPEIPI